MWADTMSQRPALTHSVIKLLETYNDKSGLTGDHDYRPKTLEKLRAILKKRLKVLYVSPILDVAIGCGQDGSSVTVGDLRKLSMQPPMLNKTLWDKGKEKAEKLNRYMHILPCDSLDEHKEIKTNLKQWFETERNNGSEDPINLLLKACTLEKDIDPQTILDILKFSGIVVEKHGHATLNLPPERVIKLLEEKIVEYETYCQNFFQEATVQSQQTFITHLSQVNSQMAESLKTESGLYCEDQFASSFPKYEKTYTRSQNIAAGAYSYSHTLYALSSQPMETQSEVEIPKVNPQSKEEFLPSTLTAEAAKALLLLSKDKTKPTTIQDVKTILEPACKVLYIVSPMPMLPSLELGKPIPPNNFYRLLIGSRVDKALCILNDPSKIVDHLRFRKKIKAEAPPMSPSEKYRMQLLARFGGPTRPEPVPETPETKQEKLKNFHAEVIRRADNLAKHKNAVLIYGDQEAQKNCRDRFSKWLQGEKKKAEDPSYILSRNDFTIALFNLSCEDAEVTEDFLLQLLEGGGYLKVVKDKVQYSTGYAALSSLEEKMKQLAVDFEKTCEPHCSNIKEEEAMDDGEAQASALKRFAPRGRFGGRGFGKRPKLDLV